ncbi:MAG TPA: ATP-binding protein [Chloroflexota bacterium]|nr:ATP-binding protein [Chloroflexota bacterium]
MTIGQDPPPVPAAPDHLERTLLIADVSALTGVAPPRLRSWEQAGLLHPRRTPNGIRLYGIEDVARVRLLQRTVVNPGRRGSLRRLAAQFADGVLLPAPEDYAGLAAPRDAPALLTNSDYWQAVVETMDEFVIVCDLAGKVTSINRAFRSILPCANPPPPVAGAESDDSPRPGRSLEGYPLPSPVEMLPLRWAALTGTEHREVPLLLRGPDRVERRTLWSVIPLRDANGALHGAVGVGRAESEEQSTREDLLATAAHDLRGPVTTILGRVQLARRAMERLRTDETVDARETRLTHLSQHLARAELSTNDLIRSMNTMLDASAAATGALIQNLEPDGIAFDELALRAAERAQEHTSRHLLTMEAPAETLLVAGDSRRLSQVLDNLLANAIKYAPDGGPITLRLEAVANLPTMPPDPVAEVQVDPSITPRWVVARIADMGLGIPSDAVPYVFDRYWRAPGPTQKISGTGLGLYTCRAIVLAHGGHIWVEKSLPIRDATTQPGEWHGTVIALVLPLAGSHQSATAFGSDGAVELPGPPVG